MTLTMGNALAGKESPYRMEAVLNSIGASLDGVLLSDFNLTVGDQALRYPLLTELVGPDGALIHSYVTSKVHLRDWGVDVDLHDVAWNVEAQSAGEVVFGATIQNGPTPILHLRKTFTLPAQPAASMRHDMVIDYQLKNLTDRSLTAILTHCDALGLRQEDIRFNDRSLYTGLLDETVYVATLRIDAGAEVPVYRSEDPFPLMWVAVANKYFVSFTSPRPLSGHSRVDWVQEIKQIPVAVDSEQDGTSTFRITTTPIVLEPGQTRNYTIDTYLGPKSRDAFQRVPDYQDLGYQEQVLASYSMGACAFMTPKSLTLLMVWMLNSLEAVVLNYGIAIIVLVLIVRTLLHPITKKGQVNMMRMQEQMGKIAPKMEEIKKRFPNDKQRQSQEMMKMYQQEGINPASGFMSSCLPMFLQMPIWIALFTSLNFNIDMRHQPFFLWIRDLSAPDALIRFSGEFTIPLISSLTGPITSFNLLPILVSAAMFAQQKLMPKPRPPAGQSDEKAAQAAQMQKMMPYMTLFFGLLFYNMPSGLNLYIGASSFFGSLEQWRIRKHIAALREQPSPVAKKPAEHKKPGLFMRLQKAAQEAQHVKSNRPKKRKR